MEERTKEEIVKWAIVRAENCGAARDLKDVIVFLENEIEKYREKIHGLEDKAEKLTDRAERAEKEIREARTMTMYDAEIDARRYDDETVVTINRKPQEILSVSVLFANANEEGGEDDGEN